MLVQRYNVLKYLFVSSLSVFFCFSSLVFFYGKKPSSICSDVIISPDNLHRFRLSSKGEKTLIVDCIEAACGACREIFYCKVSIHQYLKIFNLIKNDSILKSNNHFEDDWGTSIFFMDIVMSVPGGRVGDDTEVALSLEISDNDVLYRVIDQRKKTVFMFYHPGLFDKVQNIIESV